MYDLVKKSKSVFLKSNTLRSMSSLMTGSIIAQIIMVITSPVVTRLFSPNQFGFYISVITAISIFGPIICGKYEMSIITSKDSIELKSNIIISVIFTFILSTIIGIVYPLFFIKLNQTNFFNSTILIQLSIFTLLVLYGLNSVFTSLNNKYREYNMISNVTITKSFFQNVTLIIFGTLQIGVVSFIFSQVISSLAGLRKLTKIYFQNGLNKLKISNKIIYKYFINGREQLFYNAPSALFSTLSQASIVIFLGFMYDSSVVGWYGLSNRMLGLPFTLISANIAKIYFEKASNQFKKTKEFKKTFLRTLLFLVLTTVPLMTLIFVFSPLLFSYGFGTDWHRAGVFVQLMIPMYCMKLIVDSLTTSFIIVGKQKVEFFIQLSSILFQFLVYFYIWENDLSVNSAILTISLIVMANYLILLMFMLKIINRKGVQL